MKIDRMTNRFLSAGEKLRLESELPLQARIYIVIPVTILLAGCIWPQILKLSQGLLWLSFCLEAAVIGIPPLLNVSILPRTVLKVGSSFSFFVALISMLTEMLLTDFAVADLTDTKIGAGVSAVIAAAASALFFWFIWEYRRAEEQASDTFETEEQDIHPTSCSEVIDVECETISAFHS